MNEQIKDLMKHYSHVEAQESRESLVEAIRSTFSVAQVRRMAIYLFRSQGTDKEIGSVY